MLTFEEIKELLELVAQRGLQGLEVERAGFRLKIEGQPRAVAAAPAPEVGEGPRINEPPPPAASPAPAAAPPKPASGPEAALAQGHHVVTSPIVGTFYRSPSPDAEPYVQIGDRVKKGQVLCIVEAMKIMNEIESDAAGVVVEIYPQNAQPVEFGEPLYAIKAE